MGRFPFFQNLVRKGDHVHSDHLMLLSFLYLLGTLPLEKKPIGLRENRMSQIVTSW